MALIIFRALFVLASAGTAYSIGEGLGRPYTALVLGIIISLCIMIAEWFVSRGPIALISAIVFGSLIGMLFASLSVNVIGLAVEEQILMPIRSELTGALIVIFCYLGITFIYQSREKFNLILPYVEFRKDESGPGPIVLDTSVVIDGRLPGILETGIVEGPVLVPEIVLHELQRIADSHDKLKRERGRLGLDSLKELQESDVVDVSIYDLTPSPGQPVDDQLVQIARLVNGRLMTNDYNLNRVASLEGVTVLNLNQVANALKPIALRDEVLSVKLAKQGEQAHQAVGYLPDGTLVVVEGASGMIGATVDVAVRNTITRETGRIIFGRLVDE
jgi:uncharacterized protein YacL